MSLALDTLYSFDDSTSATDLELDRLGSGDAVRSGGLDEDHVRLLMETADQWPPIVVWGADNLVVDGAHRVAAARRLGERTIMATRFVGSRDEAFVESVRRNVDHGLPLSIADRRRASLRVLSHHPEWSDRRIASLCGLSGKTIARLRRDDVGAMAGHSVVIGMDRRVGRDGKARPVQSGEVRDRIQRALEENPTGSLRVIAALAGASPETVRAVRARMNDPEQQAHPVDQPRPHPMPEARLHGLPTLPIPPFGLADLVTDDETPDRWSGDPALLTCGDGGEFADWFAANRVGEEWHRFVWTVPIGRVYDVVDEARRRATAWTSFASLLEARTR
jgi:hypothetical protein